MECTRNVHAVALSALLAAVVALTGCNKKNDNSLMALAPFLPAPCPELTAQPGVTVVDSGSAWIERGWHCYYLLRLDYDGKESSYAMWIPPLDGGIKPAVVLTQPYDYIKWNGDDVPAGVNVYSSAEYVKNATLHLLNGCGVLYVFERFYAGGDIRNDVDDTVAGLRFLNESAVADNTRIGIWGGSWGGFEALYGAAYASDGGGVVPKAGIAFFPLSDFVSEVNYIEDPMGDIPNIADTAKRVQYQTFFEPYLDRIKATTGWETWDRSALLAELTTPFVVVHDEWDTLVPFEQSDDLAIDRPSLITPLFFYQTSSRVLDDLPYGWGHGELREYRLDDTPPPADNVAFGISNTLAGVYLYTRIANADQTMILAGYDLNALNDFIAYLRDYKCVHAREDMAWAAALLHDCTDTRILMLEMNNGTWGAGAEIIAKAFSEANWGGTGYGTASTVRDALGASGGTLPDCP